MVTRDDYEKQRDKGKVTRLTCQIWTWEEEGQSLVGTVLRVEIFSEGQFDTEVKSYIIETEGGIITTVLGSATDKQLAKIDLVGKKIFIEYRGKKALKDARSVNLFIVDVW